MTSRLDSFSVGKCSVASCCVTGVSAIECVADADALEDGNLRPEYFDFLHAKSETITPLYYTCTYTCMYACVYFSACGPRKNIRHMCLWKQFKMKMCLHVLTQLAARRGERI